jgi:hypothetical protein
MQQQQFPRPLVPPTFIMHQAVPIVPVPTPSAAAAAAATISDPVNDASCWTEYSSPDGRKYWHNRSTSQSTYEKPFCLKTPEERSIAPCPWKEYVNDGKKYYSNGTESL